MIHLSLFEMSLFPTIDSKCQLVLSFYTNCHFTPNGGMLHLKYFVIVYSMSMINHTMYVYYYHQCQVQIILSQCSNFKVCSHLPPSFAGLLSAVRRSYFSSSELLCSSSSCCIRSNLHLALSHKDILDLSLELHYALFQNTTWRHEQLVTP